MKKILKVILPSAFLLVFGISLMFVVSGCVKEGARCSKCVTDQDCDPGLYCVDQLNGYHKCEKGHLPFCG